MEIGDWTKSAPGPGGRKPGSEEDAQESGALRQPVSKAEKKKKKAEAETDSNATRTCPTGLSDLNLSQALLRLLNLTPLERRARLDGTKDERRDWNSILRRR